jgi:hypothetical protein
VSFDGTSSTDPEGTPVTYSWDLNGDQTFGDSSASTATFTYTSAGTYTAGLRVTDGQGTSDTTSITITVGNSAPTAVMDAPSPNLTWKVGDTISFTGHATDPQDGSLPASSLSWSAIMHHCYSASDCHTHVIQQFNGVTGGSFQAPDHQYPCWLEIQLTATDSGGLTSTTSVRLDPRTVVLTFRTNPGGLKLANLGFNESAVATPFNATVVVGSANSAFAPSPQAFNRSTYYFSSWSDGPTTAGRTIVAPAASTTYTAIYRKR